MKKNITILMTMLCVYHSIALPNIISFRGAKWTTQVFKIDVNGGPFESRFADVSGTPYFNEEYKLMDISLKQGNRKFVKIKAKINLVTQEVVFLSANGIEGSMEAGTVKEVSYTDTTDRGIIPYVFRTGYPAIEKQTDKYFYQVLADGKCSLLRSLVKKVIERKNELPGENSKEFETIENIYLFAGGEMKRFKKDKDFILAALADKQQQVNQFVLDKKINFKNQEQVIQLLNYYNSL